MTTDAHKAAGYTRKPTREEAHREALAKLPPWTEDPLERLEHTLAFYPNVRDDDMALYATSCIPAIPGLPSMTGITYADLRALAAELRATRTELARQTPNKAVRFGYNYLPGGYVYSMNLDYTEAQAAQHVAFLRNGTDPEAALFRRDAGTPDGPWEPVALTPETGGQ